MEASPSLCTRSGIAFCPDKWRPLYIIRRRVPSRGGRRWILSFQRNLVALELIDLSAFFSSSCGRCPLSGLLTVEGLGLCQSCPGSTSRSQVTWPSGSSCRCMLTMPPSCVPTRSASWAPCSVWRPSSLPSRRSTDDRTSCPTSR